MIQLDTNPRLCGGLFLELILQALKPKLSADEHYKGKKDGLDNQSVLIGLIKVADKNYVSLPSKSFGVITSGYLKGTKATSEHLPFGKPAIVTAFNEMIQSNYIEGLRRMTDFTERFIDVGKDSKKDIWLGKALLEFIQLDTSINAPLYCLENGQTIKREDIIKCNSICLPALLLGLWHFIFMHRSDNKATDWKMDVMTLGKSIQDLSVTMPVPEILYHEEENSEPTVEAYEFYKEETQQEEIPHVEVCDAEPSPQEKNVFNILQYINKVESGSINIGYVNNNYNS
jgi:hypothetical protein